MQAGLLEALVVGMFFNVLHGFEQLFLALSKRGPQRAQGLGFALLRPQQVALAEAAVQVDGQRLQLADVRHNGGELLLQLLYFPAVPAPGALHRLLQAPQHAGGHGVSLQEGLQPVEAVQLQLGDVPGLQEGLQAAVSSAAQELSVADVDLRSGVQVGEHGLAPLGEFEQRVVKLLHQRQVALKICDPGGENAHSEPLLLRGAFLQLCIELLHALLQLLPVPSDLGQPGLDASRLPRRHKLGQRL
ncbi:hypothetical protein EYF80_036492 [Liparis tanakae]|uniref:Uncharacterized protein n=1 Tax=Liparis tanakae TaxID=230148 RepID=A0A4Z2GII4_9TELE|nr:hypothetical protein EYF80_036492 [Liparis tanakae]